MFTKSGLGKFTLDFLLEEVNNSVKKERIRAYCDILACYPQIFEKMSKIMEYYSDRKRSPWTVSISELGEKDFYLVSFFPKEESKKTPVFLFWKIMRDRKYTTILSIALQNYSSIRNSLDSLVNYAKGLWFTWVGSRFLENFDVLLDENLEIRQKY